MNNLLYFQNNIFLAQDVILRTNCMRINMKLFQKNLANFQKKIYLINLSR